MSKAKGKPPARAPVASGPSRTGRARALLADPRVRRSGPAAAALLALLISLWTFDPKLGLSGDDTEFITLARSLAAGSGLTYTNLPEPTPATKYPFGFPLTLAPLSALYGGWDGPGSGTPDWIAMKGLVVLTFAGAMALLYALVRDQAGHGCAAAATLLAVTNPLTVSYGHQVMSEVPYLLLSLLSLWLLERGVERGGWRDNGALWAGVLTAIAAYHVRSVGIVLVGAAVAHLALRRDWSRAGLVAAASVIAAIPWALRNRAVGGGGVYFQQLVQVNPYFPDQGLLDPAGLALRVAHHAKYYLSNALVRTLWPTFMPAASAFNPGAVLMLAALGWFAWVAIRQRRHRLLLIYAAFFTGTVLLWPWPGDRFFVPLVPILLFFVVGAVADLMTRLRRVGARRGVLMAAVLLGVAVSANGRGLVALAGASRADYAPAWRNYYEAGLWLRANTPADAVVTCRKSFWTYVISGRRAFVYAFDEPAALMADLERQGTDYAIVEQLGYIHTARFLIPAVEAAPERFRLVWRRPNPDTAIFAFGLPAGGP